jgi:hypothetical protein
MARRGNRWGKKSDAEPPPQVEGRGAFRITAVRRTRSTFLARLLGADRPHRSDPISDEELIEALWRHREALEDRVRAALAERGARAVAVTLEELRPEHSIIAIFRFAAETSESLENALAMAAAGVTVATASVLEATLGDVAVAAIPTRAEAAAPAEDSTKKTAWERLAPFLGAIATGIGVVGFVTFVGGVILSARLNAAGFPTEAALGVVPAQDMLVIGAETLVPPVIWGFVLVAALFLLRVIFLGWRGGLSTQEARLVKEQGPRLMALAIFLYTAAALIAATVYSLARDLPGDHFWILIVAVALAMVPAAVARITPRLVYAIVAVFLTLGVFLTYLAFERASSNPQYRGAAVIRSNKKATIGFFVAEGSGRIYLARVNLRKGTADIFDPASRLVGIDKSQVSDWAVGGPKGAADAVAQAKALARELCQIEPKEAPAAAAAGATSGAAQPTTSTKPENCWTGPAGTRQP